MQPQTRGSRAYAIFEWNRSTAGGGGGNTEPSGRQGQGTVCMVRGEDPGEEKSTARGGGRRRRCAVAMRGVWILLKHMKWKKGTDGGDAGGRKKMKRQDRCSCILCCTGATLREIQGSVCILPSSSEKKKIKANERALTLEGI